MVVNKQELLRLTISSAVAIATRDARASLHEEGVRTLRPYIEIGGVNDMLMEQLGISHDEQ